jgi:hypothetical protein
MIADGMLRAMTTAMTKNETIMGAPPESKTSV